MKIKEEGSNLSEGEKKTIAFCRSLVSKKKLVILDEATAAMDKETEKKILKRVMMEFKDSTMLVIAHRLETVRDCDKIMVLDKGKIAEFGTPEELMKIENGMFRKLISLGIQQEK